MISYDQLAQICAPVHFGYTDGTLSRLDLRNRIKESSRAILGEFQKALPKLEPVEFHVEEYEALLDKKRWLYRMSDEAFLLDKLLSLDLSGRAAPRLPRELMSFQKGIGPFHVLNQTLEWMRASSGKGLFVIRTDLKSYTDSIRVTESSPIWAQLEDLGYLPHDITHLKSVLRPIIDPDILGGERARITGIPTGLALTPVIANLYSIELDRMATSEPGIFYRRYGDDILIGSLTREPLQAVWHRMQPVAARLGLTFHPEKTKHLYWCRNGFTPPDEAVYRSTQYLDLLGFQIQYTKGLRLNREKMHELKSGFVQRLELTRALLRNQDLERNLEDRARILVAVANRYFSPDSRERNGRLLDFYFWVNDPGQLKELEDFTARVLTQAIAGIKSTRAYSKVSWKDLIQKYGWQSPRHQWTREKKRRAD